MMVPHEQAVPGFRLSTQQQRVWSAQRSEQRTLCAIAVISVGFGVDTSRVRAAIDQAVTRHEILRTLFRQVAGLSFPVQEPVERLPYAFADARATGHETFARANEMARAKVDPHAGPLLSARLMRAEAGADWLILAVPRLAADRHSVEQLAAEIRASLDQHSSLPAADVQYVDYAEWQHELLQGESAAAAERFWQTVRAAGSPDVDVNWEARSRAPSSDLRRLELWNEDVEASVTRLQLGSGMERPAVLLALWAVFLATAEERDRLVIGVDVDARSEAVAGVLGPFAFRIPVDLALDRQASLRKNLRRASLRMEESRSWLHYFQQPIEAGRCSFTFAHIAPSVDSQAIAVDIDEPVDFKLRLEYCEPNHLSLVCPQGKFSDAALAIRAQQFAAFVSSAAEDPGQVLMDVDWRGRGERQRILEEFNSPLPRIAGVCIHQLIEARVATDGAACAIVSGEQEWSFSQLNERANQLAHQLRLWGVGAEQLVAVCAERSADLVVSLLAILKAGGAYLPLDPAYPAERIAYMLSDSKARVVITQERLLSVLPKVAARVWCLDRDAGEIVHQPVHNPSGLVHPRSLAYCIYTSGSTGRPKACQIEHASLSHYLLWASRHYFDAGGQGGSFGLYSSLSFDLTVTSLFLPLLRGKCLRVFAEDVPVDEVLKRSFAPGSTLDAIKLTPSHIALLRSGNLPPTDVSLAIVGGEALLPEQVYALHELNPSMRVFNEYGPTEATVGCVVQLVDHDVQEVPIGRPIDGCRVYVVDARGELAALGAKGELHIAGVGLARGYRGRPGLTAERFIADAHSDIPGARVYRTGDLVRYQPNGILEYLGRADHQVKVRGHRIELGEIEARLAQLDGVREAAVLALEGESGERRLVAYIVTETSAAGDIESRPREKERLRTQLTNSLPDYMVPAQYVFLARLPLNANGKIDRKALPAPDSTGRHAELVAPRNPVEEQLARIWRQVLKLDRVGVHDNFFELGGDSIVAIQAVSKARDAGLGFTPKELFQHPCIAELALVTRQLQLAAARVDVVAGEVPLTPIQHWFFALPLSRRNHWNQSVLLQFARPLNAELLERSLQLLLRHHDALRLRFQRRPDGSWRQWHDEGTPMPLSTEVRIDATIDVADAIEKAANGVQQSLDLSAGPVLRALQMVLPDGSARLLLVIHHLVVDGVSWRILLEDLKNLYRGAVVTLPPKSSAFQTWALALQGYANSERALRELDYWRSMVSSAAGTMTNDCAADDGTDASRQFASVELDEHYTRLLLTQAHMAYRTQINDLLLTALTRTLCDWTGQDTAFIELEGHGREDLDENVDASRTVGWFTTLYPLRLDARGENLTQAILSVKEQLRDVPCNGIGYGVLRFLRGHDELRCAPNASIARFNHLGQFDAGFDAAGDWRPASESSGQSSMDSAGTGSLLDWITRVYRGKLQIRCTHGSCIDGSRVQRLLDRYVGELRALVDHCLMDDKGALSPSDVPLADMSQRQLDHLPVPARNIEDVYPLSPMQQGLLLHTLLNPGSGMYLMQDVFYIAKALDSDAVQRAWERLVSRHAILRTSFLWNDDAAPVQIVHRTVLSPVRLLDWSGMERAAAEERLRQILREEIAEGFEVTQPSLLRLRLVRLSAQEHLLAHSFHHILMDAWCRSLLFQDFFACYAAELSHVDSSLPEPRRYRDFIAWLGRQDQQAARHYWREELAGFTSVTSVPLARKSPAGSISTVTDLVQRLSVEETKALNQFVQEHRLTANTLVQGAWAAVLAQHADQEEVLFGVTVAGRPTELAGIENTLGLFINSLPLRVQLPRPGEQVSVVEWLQTLQAKNVAMRQHEHLPLVEIQALSAMAPGVSLFDTLFVFENAPFEESVVSRAGELGFQELSGRTHTNYPLTVVAAPGSRFLLELSCDLRFFDTDTAGRLLQQFKSALLTLITHPRASLHELSWLSPMDQARLADYEALAASTYSLRPGFVERFEEQVRVRGDATAARCGDARISYSQLNAEANRLAHVLLQRGVRRDDLVVLHAQRGFDLLQMILAVFKSGAGYLALEPDYPLLRFQQVLRVAQPRLVLTTRPHRERVAMLLQDWREARPDIVLMDESPAHDASADNPGLHDVPQQLAYVIYTSGSTGVPKGVMVEQAGMLNNQLSKIAGLGLDSHDVIAQTASCSFDISVWQWLTALLCGACVEVVPEETAQDPRLLLQAVRDRGITVLESVPALIQAMLKEEKIELPTLRYLIATGEALPAPVARQWLERYPGIPLLNAYGPAECSDDVSMHRETTALSDAETHVAIGRATPNNGLYVLGGDLQRLPVGAIGEICVAGTGIGRGYLRDPRRTAPLFVPNPYGTDGDRLYRTGDAGRYGPDGVLEYLGRIDHQVKILGYRIEPGEIEARLLEHPEVEAAAVLVAREDGAARRLIGYVVPAIMPTDDNARSALRERLRAHLLRSLPKYMVPAQYVWLTKLPLSGNGKIDRLALNAMGVGEARPAGVAPRNPTEAALAQIWREVLKVEAIGVHDDFFAAGGHSLLATQVASRIRHRLGVELSLRTVFETPTIAALAREVERCSAPLGDAKQASLMSSLLEALETP